MSSLDGILSDLSAAGRLSRRLVGERVPLKSSTTVITDESAEPYVRFQPRDRQVSEELPADDVSEPVSAPDREEISTWRGFLAWCSGIAGSAAFVVDSQGFIIAASDDDVPEQYRGAGAELGFAAEQLARFDSGSGILRVIDVEYRRRRVTILRVGEDEPLLITVVSSSAIPQQIKDLILEQADLVLPMPE